MKPTPILMNPDDLLTMPDGDRSPRGHVKLAPDLAVEVVSPIELYEEVEARVNEYLAAGVKLVWVVSPGSRTVLVRRPDGTCHAVGAAGELSGEDVLPGFACKVAELFVSVRRHTQIRGWGRVSRWAVPVAAASSRSSWSPNGKLVISS
jgi:Uma2 family endonuclease